MSGANVYVGGTFNTAREVTTNHMARWNGLEPLALRISEVFLCSFNTTRLCSRRMERLESTLFKSIRHLNMATSLRCKTALVFGSLYY